jgi:hypothetical protein
MHEQQTADAEKSKSLHHLPRSLARRRLKRLQPVPKSARNPRWDKLMHRSVEMRILGREILSQKHAAGGVTRSAGNPVQISIRNDARYRLARLASTLAIAALYFWIIGIGAENRRFAWDSGLDAYYGLSSHAAVQGSADVNGYYDLLGRAIAAGKLRLPVEPSPELLALADPWSDQINRPFRLLDAVLYRQHYYLYHGAAPALLLFTPWYVITKHDFPENFAAFLLSLGAYLFLSALFSDAISALSIHLPLSVYALFLVALGSGQGVPFLLHRVKVYEVAIACGYFCLSAGFYFIFRCLTSSGREALWAALSGAAFGLAIGSRPHLGMAAIPALCLLLLQSPRTRLARRFVREDVLAFTIPFMLCSLGIAAYNYARFDAPLEFGTCCLLGGDNYRNFHLSMANLTHGLNYLLAYPPDLVPEFPFLRLAVHEPVPAEYFREPTAGVLSLCPIILFVLMIPVWREFRTRQRAVFGVLAAMFASAICSILLLAAVPLSSQRFVIDFLPYLLFTACVVAGSLLSSLRQNVIRIVATIGVVGLLLYSITSNLALGIQGPYDQFVQASPGSYVKLARWFSPVERFRPLLNPMLHMRAVFEFAEACPKRREALLSAGEFGSRYLLSAECAGPGRIRLISESSVRHPEEGSVELPFASPWRYEIGLDFTPESRTMKITWNRDVVLQHPLRFLVTARSQIHFGWDPDSDWNTFEGHIRFPFRLFDAVRSPN